MMEDKSPREGSADYVTLLGIAGLSLVAGTATFYGQENIALTCIGAIAGVITRLYR